jgi:ATP-dependent helicase/DNAse subunit B
VHEVLERYVGALISAGSARGDVEGKDRLEQVAAEVFARYERLGRTGKGVLWELERRRLLAALESERLADELRHAQGVVPLAVEHTFGFDASPPVAVTVGGRRLAFRGMIDRVDAMPDGGVKVIDYKTGRSDSFRGIEEDPVDRGRHLQLAIYALAAREAFAPGGAPVRAAFRFLAGSGGEISLSLEERSRRRFEEVLDVLVGAIDNGVFPYRPGESNFDAFDNCRYCDYDAICPSDRAERWEAVRFVPGLARYRTLVEGEVALDNEGGAGDDLAASCS